MTDKKESCVDTSCHGRSNGDGLQTSTTSNHGNRKQFRNKGSSYVSRDKRGSEKWTPHARHNEHRPHPIRTLDQRPSQQRTGQYKNTPKRAPDPLSQYEERGYKGGKKKPSLNYLLNFTITPTERRSGNVGVSERRHWRTHTGHSYNKEQFLQANCQFVVSVSGDYTVHNSDPDLLVDWEHIEQLRLFCHQIPSCPICLYPPKAAKITRCGHVYCWSCVLHYLSLSDKKWRKCPICYESIYCKDLKSVAAFSSHQYTAGDSLTLRLMARKKGTTLVLPREEWSKKRNGLLNIQDTSVNQYAKLLTASPAQVLALITGPERSELQSQLDSLEADSASERCFIESALCEVETRESQLRAAVQGLEDIESTEAVISSPVESPSVPGRDQHNESSSEDTTQSDCSITSSPSTVDSTLSVDNELVHFYQACDGQYLYLHPVNVKCLIKEYGGLEMCPDQIQATVVELDDLTISETVRSRYRYLSHLPLTSELSLVELDLKPPLLSKGTLTSFAEDLTARKQQRMKKKREERRRERKTGPKEPIDSAAFIVPTSAQDMTPEVFHDFLSLTSTPSTPHTPSQPHQQSEGEDTPSTPSFSQALKGKAPPMWPAHSPPTAWSGVGTGRGCVKIEAVDDVEEGAVPTYKDAFNDALASASVSVLAAQNAVSGGKPGSKTAKKGRKKMVLFSTGSTRSSN